MLTFFKLLQMMPESRQVQAAMGRQGRDPNAPCAVCENQTAAFCEILDGMTPGSHDAGLQPRQTLPLAWRAALDKAGGPDLVPDEDHHQDLPEILKIDMDFPLVADQFPVLANDGLQAVPVADVIGLCPICADSRYPQDAEPKQDQPDKGLLSAETFIRSDPEHEQKSPMATDPWEKNSIPKTGIGAGRSGLPTPATSMVEILPRESEASNPSVAPDGSVSGVGLTAKAAGLPVQGDPVVQLTHDGHRPAVRTMARPDIGQGLARATTPTSITFPEHGSSASPVEDQTAMAILQPEETGSEDDKAGADPVEHRLFKTNSKHKEQEVPFHPFINPAAVKKGSQGRDEIKAAPAGYVDEKEFVIDRPLVRQTSHNANRNLNDQPAMDFNSAPAEDSRPLRLAGEARLSKNGDPEATAASSKQDLRLSETTQFKAADPTTGRSADRAPETTSPAPNREESMDAIRQIVQRMTLRQIGSQNQMVIRLKPDILGQLRLYVQTENHQVAVRMTAESQAVKEMIENNLHHLKVELQQHGLEVQKIDVAVQHDNEGWKNGHQPAGFEQNAQRRMEQHRRRARQNQPSTPVSSVSADEAGGAPRKQHISGTSGEVDYFV